MKLKKSISLLVTSLFLALVSCEGSIPNNSVYPENRKLYDPEKEYAFSTKALTKAYIERKIEKWLDKEDGNALLKDVNYAMHKYPGVFTEVVEDTPGLCGRINAMEAISARKTIDVAFNLFTEECNQSTSQEFHVNTFTTHNEMTTSIAMDYDGNFIIAWNSYVQDGSEHGAYAQRYYKNGTPRGSEFRINTYTTGPQGNPSIGMDNAGGFVVAWQSDGQVNGWDIFAQRYDSNGQKITTGGQNEFMVNTGNGFHETSPSAAMDDDGDFIITWDTYGASSTFAQRYHSDGTKNGTEFKASSSFGGFQRSPVVAMDSDGDFVITWYGNGIFAQRFNSAGVEQGGWFQVNDYPNSNFIPPTVAMDNDGDFVIAWTSSGQDGSGFSVYAKRYNSFGVAQGNEFRVNTYTTDNQSYPSVALDEDGDFIVSWTDYIQDGSARGVYAQRYKSNGDTIGSEFRVNSYTTSTQDNPSVVMDRTGDFVITWQGYHDQLEERYGVFAMRYNSAGVPQ
jgi:hypothetical protein